MVDMQLPNISDLLSLNHKLIPKQLALAFGIGTGEELHDSNKQNLVASGKDDEVEGHEIKPTLGLKRQRTADDDTDDKRTTFAAKPGTQQKSPKRSLYEQQPSSSQPNASSRPPQLAASMQQQDAAAMAHAAASMQAAALVQQAAASMQTIPSQAAAAAASASAMQTQSGVSGGYPPTTAATSHPMLNAYRGFPAAAVGTAYPFSGHPLMPYMAASHQAMATMSNMSGSLGCAPMSMYSGGPVDYQSMQRQDDEAEDNQARALKRPRLVWTPQLHKLFEEAVQKLGVDKAVPKTIMQLMKVDGLTRENVASHLQKYRLSLKKSTDTDKGSGGNTSAEGGTGDGAGSDKAGNAAATSTAAATGGVNLEDGSGGSTAAGGSTSGGDGIGSTGEAGTSSSKPPRVQQGSAPGGDVQEAADAAAGAAADKLQTMQQVCKDGADDAAAAAAEAAAAAAAVVQE